MKTASIPAPINLNVVLIALLFVALVFVTVTDKRVPFISNPRVAMVGLLVLGLAMCQISGIGRVAALGEWAHPLAILGYLLGAAILVISVATIFGWKLPYIHSEVQAIVIVALLTGAKIVNTVAHSWLPRGG